MTTLPALAVVLDKCFQKKNQFLVNLRNTSSSLVDKNYVIGVTYRDKIDSNGDPVATWDFAMVFDDKQRVIIDKEANGDFGTSWPIGHQIFGPDQFRVGFQDNTGLSTLQAGLQVVGVNTGARASIADVVFDSTTGANAYISGTIDIKLDSGSFVEGEQFNYVTSIQTGAQQSLTTSGTTAANKITYTTDPTGVIPPATYVYLSDVGNAAFYTFSWLLSSCCNSRK